MSGLFFVLSFYNKFCKNSVVIGNVAAIVVIDDLGIDRKKFLAVETVVNDLTLVVIYIKVFVFCNC